MPKVRATRGIRYPKGKKIRDAIRAGEATSADVEEWVRVKKDESATLPQDMIPDFDRRGSIEKES